jgi:hypothetical protein
MSAIRSSGIALSRVCDAIPREDAGGCLQEGKVLNNSTHAQPYGRMIEQATLVLRRRLVWIVVLANKLLIWGAELPKWNRHQVAT